MEQQIQPQPERPITHQDNKNKVIVAVAISVIITALVIVTGVYFFTKREVDKIIEQQNTQNSNELTPISTNNNVVVSGINPKDYSLASYPLKQSPIYKQLDKNCLDPYWADTQDMRLIKNGTKIILPSLIQTISTSKNQQPDCAMVIEIFSIPSDGKYLYLTIHYVSGSDAPNSGLNGIYRVDLSNLSVKELSVSDFVGTFDLYRGSASDSYKILADGKRIIKWSMSGAYLVNLETDSKSDLYTAPQNQWLISGIEFGMGQIAQYDLKINGNQIAIGVYDKTKTQEGYPIKVDQYGNVTVESIAWDREGGTIKPKFINRVTVALPK